MNSYVRPALALLFLCIVAALPACGTREKSQTEPAAVPETRIIRATGGLVPVGNGPFNDLSFSTPAGNWRVAREELYKLTHLQDGVRTVTVEGTEIIIKFDQPDGSIGIRRILSNITVIAIETYDGVILPIPYDIDWGGDIRTELSAQFKVLIHWQCAGYRNGGAEGSGPVPKLVRMAGGYREWNIVSGEQYKLAGLQNRTAAVAAIQAATKGKAADGSVIEIITLSDIVIIAVSEPEGNQ